MKTIMEFELPQDAEDYKMAFHGHKYCFIIQTLDNYLRSEIKYNEGLSEGVSGAYQTIRSKLWEIVADHEVTIN